MLVRIVTTGIYSVVTVRTGRRELKILHFICK
jgi:hypothetical protein